MKKFLDRTLEEWTGAYPLLSRMTAVEEVFWINPGLRSFEEAAGGMPLSMGDIEDAAARLERFAPYLAKVFPETAEAGGLIESPLRKAPSMAAALKARGELPGAGTLLVKCDSHLPISGSIKARGGIYEVLKHAEDLALAEGLLKPEDSYEVLAEDRFRNFFSRHSVAVGSTGNLGLSIGIMSAQLGFKASVHMSSDAKEWKKALLRSKGVTVVEYDSDYSLAVAEGRKQAESDPDMYFVDDENSQTLFLGYAVAALRLKKQLEALSMTVDGAHPLFVYLPCGVGGGPGGVAFGLKSVYGDAVHCFFAEPTHAPCMLLGMMTGLHEKVSVQDFGIDNITEADGLAVGRPSGFVGKTMAPLISGIYTVTDEHLHRHLGLLADSEDLWLEPSALAGFAGCGKVLSTPEGKAYLKKHGLKPENIRHMAWATGGNMVPKPVMDAYYKKAQDLLADG